MTGIQPGDTVEVTLEGVVVERIEHPAGGSDRIRIRTDDTAFDLTVYEHRADIREVQTADD